MNGTHLRSHGERGATMIETVLALPLLLFFILALIWIGVSYHERAALHSAVGSGLRLAASRSNSLLMNSGTGIIEPVTDWRASSGNPAPDLEAVLRHNIPDWGHASAWYDGCGGALRVFRYSGGACYGLRDMPEPYIYSLIYVNQALLLSIGGSIKFPCDPHGADPNGCVGRYFLNPETFDDTPFAGDPPVDKLALRCEYRPSNFLLGPLNSLLSMFMGSANDTRLLFREEKMISFRTGVIN